MGIRLRGDTAKLREWSWRFRDPKRALADASKVMAEEALDLVREGFDREQAPDGKPWAPLKDRDGKILQDTGELRNSWHRSRADARGFAIGSGKKHAVFHREGTKDIPARPMVPTGGKLPQRWKQALRKAALEIMAKRFGGRRGR